MVDETYEISFRLTTTLPDGCRMSRLRLYIDPEETADTLVIESFLLKDTTAFVMTFVPRRPDKFQIKGLRFEFFDAAPVAVTFPHPVLYRAVPKTGLIQLSLISKPEVSYPNIPFRFSVLAKRIRGTLHDHPMVLIQASPHYASLRLVSPQLNSSFNKFTLPTFERELLLEFEMVPACEGRLDINAVIGYTLMDHQSRFAVETFSIEVIGMRKIHAQIANDRVMLSRVDDLCSIFCPLAVIRVIENGVLFDEAVADSSDKKCALEIEREILGTVVRESLTIPRLFVLFQPGDLAVARFPVVVEYHFEVLCLGAYEGRVLLKAPSVLEWCWLGKTKHVLHGPGKLAVVAGILANGPVQFDIADFLSILYGNETRTFHHTISIQIA
jgi:hypothetical protein